MPGGRGLNPKNLSRMMQQLGISVKEIEGVEEVIIRTPTKDIIIPNASVSIMDAKGSRTYQVTGEATEVARMGATAPAAAAPAAPAGAPATATASAAFPEEDVALVMEGAGVDRKKALAALKKAGGEPAQAIMDLAG